jgi:hypothetical protein
VGSIESALPGRQRADRHGRRFLIGPACKR